MRLTHKKAYENTSYTGSVSHTLPYSVAARVSPIKRQVFWLGFIFRGSHSFPYGIILRSIQWYLSSDPQKPYSGGTAQVFHLFPYYPSHWLRGHLFILDCKYTIKYSINRLSSQQ